MTVVGFGQAVGSYFRFRWFSFIRSRVSNGVGQGVREGDMGGWWEWGFWGLGGGGRYIYYCVQCCNIEEGGEGGGGGGGEGGERGRGARVFRQDD